MEMQPERFKAIRKALGLNQAELGERLGLSLGWISKMELGQVPIEARTASAMLLLDFYLHIREERLQKLHTIALMESGRLRTHETRDGKTEDTTERNIQRNRDEIAEIEQLLSDAGVSFEDGGEDENTA